MRQIQEHSVTMDPTFPIKKCCLWWINSGITNFPLSLSQSLSQSQFEIWRSFCIREQDRDRGICRVCKDWIAEMATHIEITSERERPVWWWDRYWLTNTKIKLSGFMIYRISESRWRIERIVIRRLQDQLIRTFKVNQKVTSNSFHGVENKAFTMAQFFALW
jgi:hypothetical protein